MKPIKRDDFYIRDGRIHRPPIRPCASIDALQWAADKAGTSYGIFTLNLSPEKAVQIQLEYEEYKRQRALNAAVRRAEKETSDTENHETEGFIITDDDI